jgi:hypothetical protein
MRWLVAAPSPSPQRGVGSHSGQGVGVQSHCAEGVVSQSDIVKGQRMPQVARHD